MTRTVVRIATVTALVLVGLGGVAGPATAAEPHSPGSAQSLAARPAAPEPDPDDADEPEEPADEPAAPEEEPATPEEPAGPAPDAPAPAREAPDAPAPAGDAEAPAPPPVAPPADEGGTDDTAVAPVEVDPELEGARRPYPGSPSEEAALVADEDYRLNEVRTMASVSQLTGDRLKNPYRLVTGSAYTLVLTQRQAAYTLTDLLALAPQTFVRQADGAYLLSEHIVVQQGATLSLSAPGRLELRLASDAEGFVSIVSYAGRIEAIGSQGDPVTITSWDRQAGAPDTVTDDGRAYIRAIGGQVGMQNVRLTRLGFWSGRTGGLALTGTDRPNPGALNDLGKSLDPSEEKAREAAGEAPTDSTGGVTLDQALPAGDLPIPQFDIEQPQYSYVSVSLVDVFADGNAFGVFVAGANGVDIRGGGFDNSLVNGLTLHRFVTNAVIERARATGNGSDGIVLSRATTGTVLSEVDASANAHNGISISGLPLASGPSATGTSVGDYGGNAVSNSRMADNGRYGIEVIGGHDVGVNANDLTGNDMAIVVRGGARAISVVGSNVTDAARHGIAVRDGVSESTVTGNIVSGGETSVYVRASAVEVSRNTLSGASSHGVSLVADVSGTDVQENTISGRGPSAIDTARAESANTRGFDNETSGWSDTTPWLVTLKRVLQPLNLMWGLLALIVVVTAVRGVRYRTTGPRHPYADKLPVATAADVVVDAPPARSR